MLILAEGTVHRTLENDERAPGRAWLGPMVDASFLQSGFINSVGDRVWPVLSSSDRQRHTAARRLARRSGRVGLLLDY